MKKLSKEFYVGSLVCLAAILMLVFGWLMGVIGPFTREVRYNVFFNFVGGVEIGSPVRVAGVKVGKVDRIDFLPEVQETPEGDKVSLKIIVGVSPRAANTVRTDSKFYVNMAGIIGERYIEITPGGAKSPVLADGANVRGIDPPRIDQLLSQGYGVFGKILDFLQENEPTLNQLLTQLTQVMTDTNKLLKGKDKRRLIDLVENLAEMTDDLKSITRKLHNKESQEFFERLMDLVRRAHEIDKPTLKKFLQEEGIRARIF